MGGVLASPCVPSLRRQNSLPVGMDVLAPCAIRWARLPEVLEGRGQVLLQRLRARCLRRALALELPVPAHDEVPAPGEEA